MGILKKSSNTHFVQKIKMSDHKPLQEVSSFKNEYLEIDIPKLYEGEITDCKLKDFLSGKCILLFYYEHDFKDVANKAMDILGEKCQEFSEAGCQIVACSTDSAQIHMAWQHTPREDGEEEAPGLGKTMPFPILGDQTRRLSRSMGVLDEEKSTVMPALVILNPEGDIIYRDMAGARSPLALLSEDELKKVMKIVSPYIKDNTAEAEEDT